MTDAALHVQYRTRLTGWLHPFLLYGGRRCCPACQQTDNPHPTPPPFPEEMPDADSAFSVLSVRTSCRCCSDVSVGRFEKFACTSASIWHGAVASCGLLYGKHPKTVFLGGETYTPELPSYTLFYTRKCQEIKAVSMTGVGM